MVTALSEHDERGLVSPEQSNTSELPKEMFRRTKLCKFELMGKCKNGENCAYAHGSSNLAPKPDFSRTRLCRNFLAQGTCPAEQNCKFAHGESELRSRPLDGLPEAREDHTVERQGQCKESPMHVEHFDSEVAYAMLQQRLQEIQMAREQLDQMNLLQAQARRQQLQQFHHPLPNQHRQVTPQKANTLGPNLLQQANRYDTSTSSSSTLPRRTPAENSQPSWQRAPGSTRFPMGSAKLNGGRDWSATAAPFSGLGGLATTEEGRVQQTPVYVAHMNSQRGANIGNDVHTSKAKSRTRPTFPGASSLDERASVCSSSSIDGHQSQQAWSRQTTMELPFTRQATPAEDFGDSPYGSDVDQVPNATDNIHEHRNREVQEFGVYQPGFATGTQRQHLAESGNAGAFDGLRRAVHSGDRWAEPFNLTLSI